MEVYEDTRLSRAGDVDYELTIPRTAEGSFTYSLVITEGYASQPTMVKSESVVIVSAEDLQISVNYPAIQAGDGFPLEVFFQVYANGDTLRPVDFDSG